MAEAPVNQRRPGPHFRLGVRGAVAGAGAGNAAGRARGRRAPLSAPLPRGLRSPRQPQRPHSSVRARLGGPVLSELRPALSVRRGRAGERLPQRFSPVPAAERALARPVFRGAAGRGPVLQHRPVPGAVILPALRTLCRGSLGAEPCPVP